MSFGEEVLGADIRNISDTGCLVVVNARKLTREVSVDDALQLALFADDLEARCRAVVRNVRTERALLRHVILIGVEFDASSFAEAKGVEDVVAQARLHREADAEAARWLGVPGPVR